MTQEPSVQDSREMAGFVIRQIGEIRLPEGNDGWEDITGVVLEGSHEAVRAAAQLFGERVYLTAAAPPPATSSAMEALRTWEDLPNVVEIRKRRPWYLTLEEQFALTPAAGTGVAVKAGIAVKPLEWREAEHIDDHQAWFANSIIGEFVVGFNDGWYATLDDWKWEWEPEEDCRTYHGPSAAQKACQEYLEVKLLSALAAAPPPATSSAMEATTPPSSWEEAFERNTAPVQQAGVESELVERLQQLLDEATWDSIEHDGDDDRKEADSVLAMIAASLSQLQQRIAELKFALKTAETEAGYLAGKVARTEAASDAKLAEAVAALEPFGKAAEGLLPQTGDSVTVWGGPPNTRITAGDLRRARAALQGEQ